MLSKRLKKEHIDVFNVICVVCLLSNMVIDMMSVPRGGLHAGFSWNLSWFIWAAFTIVEYMKFPLTMIIIVSCIGKCHKRSSRWIIFVMLMHAWLLIELLAGRDQYRDQYLTVYFNYVLPMMIISIYLGVSCVASYILTCIPAITIAFVVSMLNVGLQNFISASSRFGANASINPILFAAGLLISMCGMWLWYIKTTKKVMIVLLFVILFTIFGGYIVVMTASRGPIVSFIVATALVVAVKFRRFTKTLKFTVFMFCCLCVLIIWQGLQYAPDIVLQRLSGRSDESTISREYAYKLALNNPNVILGSGVGQTDLNTGLGYTHNVILESYYEHGIFMLIFIMILVVRSIWSSINVIRYSMNPAYIFVAWLCLFWICESQFSGGIYTDWQMWSLVTIMLHYIPAKFSCNTGESA